MAKFETGFWMGAALAMGFVWFFSRPNTSQESASPYGVAGLGELRSSPHSTGPSQFPAVVTRRQGRIFHGFFHGS
jgi:hypothetical protein